MVVMSLGGRVMTNPGIDTYSPVHRPPHELGNRYRVPGLPRLPDSPRVYSNSEAGLTLSAFAKLSSASSDRLRSPRSTAPM